MGISKSAAVMLAAALLLSCESVMVSPVAKTPAFSMAEMEQARTLAEIEALVDRGFPLPAAATPAEPLEYGPAARGLAIRVDAAVSRGNDGTIVLVRVRNMGDETITLPAGWRKGLVVENLANKRAATDSNFDAWNYLAQMETADDLAGALEKPTRYAEDRRWAMSEQPTPEQLAPGETAGAVVGITNNVPEMGVAAELRVKLHLISRVAPAVPKLVSESNDDPNETLAAKFIRSEAWGNPSPPVPRYALSAAEEWIGEIASPAITPGKQWPEGILPCPTYPQRFGADLTVPDLLLQVGRQTESGYGALGAWAMLFTVVTADVTGEAMKSYDAASRRAMFEHWMKQEASTARRMALAAMATELGGRDGARELLTGLREASSETPAVRGLRNAGGTAGAGQAMLQQIAIVMLEDRLRNPRQKKPMSQLEQLAAQFTHDEIEFINDGDGFWISHGENVESKLIGTLAVGKCRRAIPLLLEAERDPKLLSAALMALRDIGDPRAAAPLVARMAEPDRWEGADLTRLQAIRTLDMNLFVGYLLERFDSIKVFEHLHHADDARVAAALKKMIAGGTAKTPAHLAAARRALASTQREAGVADLCAMAQDQEMSAEDRALAILQLGSSGTQAVADLLLGLLRRDANCDTRYAAAWALQNFRYKTVARGLIDCIEMKNFPASASGEQREKVASAVFSSLRTLTQKSFNNSKEEWESWWRENQGRELQ